MKKQHASLQKYKMKMLKMTMMICASTTTCHHRQMEGELQSHYSLNDLLSYLCIYSLLEMDRFFITLVHK